MVLCHYRTATEQERSEENICLGYGITLPEDMIRLYILLIFVHPLPMWRKLALKCITQDFTTANTSGYVISFKIAIPLK